MYKYSINVLAKMKREWKRVKRTNGRIVMSEKQSLRPLSSSTQNDQPCPIHLKPFIVLFTLSVNILRQNDKFIKAPTDEQ